MDQIDTLSEEELDELEGILSELESCLAEGDVDGARSALAAAEEVAGKDDPDVRYGRALIAYETEALDQAIAELRGVLEIDPDFADAHYTLGLALEELGDHAGMVHHFLRTHALDAKLDQDRTTDNEALLAGIEQTARETLEGLPESFAQRLSSVPILLEPRPATNLVESGFDPRAFGLFEGPRHGEQDAPAPTRIVLFTANLLANFGEDELQEQVEATVLHEVGHYFGLEEKDMERLGLA